jgi:hypothetical protein
MKKIYILMAFAMLSLPFVSKAQHFESAIRLGVNATQINGDNMAGFHEAGLVAGLQVSYPFSTHWSGAFEMLWSQKGSAAVVDSGFVATGDAWFKLRLNYIEVPVMVQYKLNKRINFQAGLGWAYLFNNNFEPYYGGDSKAQFMKKMEFSTTFGAAYRFADHWSLFARYTNSLLPVNKNSSLYAAYIYGSGLYNIVASFGILYHFQSLQDE